MSGDKGFESPEELAAEIKRRKDLNRLLNVVSCIGLILVFLPTYQGAAGAAIGISVFCAVVLPCMIYSLVNYSKIKKLQEKGMELLMTAQMAAVAISARPTPPSDDFEDVNQFRTPPELPLPPYNTNKLGDSNCMVCNNPIVSAEQKFVCAHCQFTAHNIHLLIWFEKYGTCPRCRTKLHI
ncbi:MAG: E3 ubiquitin protein ligase [Candidatus Helarchaeota archaeon]|nr:E3 ubiquitin protein ligase [Candidatus Helarchaeota archaeon]